METARENYREVMTWLRGGDSTPDPRMEDLFISVLAAMVQERMSESENVRKVELAAQRRERRQRSCVPESIRSIMSELAESERRMPEASLQRAVPHVVAEEQPSTEEKSNDGSLQWGLDSYVLGMALRYMGSLRGRKVNMSQIQVMLYISYGICLADRGERLMAEHPQMWQFGPVFPRVYGRMRKDTGDGRKEYDLLEREHPRILDFLKSQFSRFAWMTASAATFPHVAEGSPWEATRKLHPDKWGAVIEDELIREWFVARM